MYAILIDQGRNPAMFVVAVALVMFPTVMTVFSPEIKEEGVGHKPPAPLPTALDRTRSAYLSNKIEVETFIDRVNYLYDSGLEGSTSPVTWEIPPKPTRDPSPRTWCRSRNYSHLVCICDGNECVRTRR